jgi:hypothetical protein
LSVNARPYREVSTALKDCQCQSFYVLTLCVADDTVAPIEPLP